MSNELTPVEVDLSDISTFDPIPNDVYELAIVSVKNQRRSSKNPANIMWDIIFQVIEGPHAKTKLFHTLVVGPTCAGFAVEFYEAIGLPYEKGVTLIDPTQWAGKTCRAETFQDEYNGRISSKVKKFVRQAS